MISSHLTGVILLICSYLLGAIPFGLIISRALGAGDIRKMGSGNIGATNVLRNVGKLGGFVTLLLDSLKGFMPVLVAKSWWGIDTWTLLVAFAAILGHNYSVYIKFKGGKGVATSIGVLLALWPYIGLITLAIWLISVFIWKYSSLGALISFALLPIVILLGERSLLYFIFSLLISLMIFYRHISNINRLLTGTEKKIGKGGSSIMLFLIALILLSNAPASAKDMAAYAPAIPDEVQRLWEERSGAISAGNEAAGEAKLDSIVKMRYQLGMDRMDDISALLVREGYRALDEGMADYSYRLSSRAKEISPYYAPAYFLSSTSLLKMSEIMEAISEYIAGIKVLLHDFRTTFDIAGRLYIISVTALSLTFLAFLIIWFSRALPIFAHTFNEVTSGFISSPIRPVFFATLVIIPLLFGIGWFVLFCLVAVWLYLSRKERVIALLMVIFFLSLPHILKYTSIYITAYNNVTLQGLLAAEKGYASQVLISRLKDSYRNEPHNIYLALSIARLLHKQGNIEESLLYYHNLLNADKKEIRIWSLNSMGNLHFMGGDYDNAIIYYKKAIEEAPDSAIPVYNLSQTYREKLMFAEADNAYETAKRINPKNAGLYSTLASRGRGYRTVDFSLSKPDLWKAALSETKDSYALAMSILRGIIKIPPERFYFLGISLMIILTVLSYLKPKAPLAYYCPRCGKSVCGQCAGSKIFGSPCRACRGKKDLTEASPKDMDRRISFLLPGLWHIYKGWTGSGGTMALLFFTGLSGFLLGKMDDPWYMAYDLPQWSLVYGGFLILLSYLVLLFHLKYIKIRFNA